MYIRRGPYHLRAASGVVAGHNFIIIVDYVDIVILITLMILFQYVGTYYLLLQKMIFRGVNFLG